MRVLVLNPGSSTLKGSLVERPGDETLARAKVDWGTDATARHNRGAGVADLIGRLLGDISFRRGNTTFYFPLATSIIASIVLTLILALLRR